jgi:hypothetical protein
VTAETIELADAGTLCVQLQWGRGRVTAETGGPMNLHPDDPSFNGAAVA